MAEFLKKLSKKYLNNQGISLVEALLTIVLAVILILSLITLTNFNIRNSLLVTENQDSISSANLLLENLRTIKDRNFTNFVTEVSSKCANSDCTIENDLIKSLTSAQVSELSSPSSYFRVVKVSDNEIVVNIKTVWVVGNSTFSSPLSTTFTNWRAR